MIPKTRPVFIGLLAAGTTASAIASTIVVDFEDVPLGPDGFYNGSDEAGKFSSSGVDFLNSYNTDYNSWSGFAVSDRGDTTTPGFGNQYSSFTGGGIGGAGSFAVGYTGFGGSALEFGGSIDLGPGGGAWITNATFAALAMRDGEAPPFGGVTTFGGEDGNALDWFLLTIEGFDGVSSTGVIEFYLADYRFEDNNLDYIVDEWTFVDFSSLGVVDSLQFNLTSSDVGEFGMNTPAYFAMDNLTIPEPTTLTLTALASGLLLRRRRS